MTSDAIDAILERHQGAMTKVEFKAAGDDIRRLLATRDAEIARLSAARRPFSDSLAERTIDSQVREIDRLRAVVVEERGKVEQLSVTLTKAREALVETRIAITPFAVGKFQSAKSALANIESALAAIYEATKGTAQ